MNEQLLTISHVSSQIGVTTHTLKSWEKEFQSYLTISRDSNNARIYHKTDVLTLLELKRLKEEGFDKKSIIQFLIEESEKLSKQKEAEVSIEEEFACSSEAIPTNDNPEELVTALTNSILHSEEMKQLLSIDNKLNELEDRLAQKVVTAIHDEVAAASDSQLKSASLGFSKLSSSIEQLSKTAVLERKAYQAEVIKERDILSLEIAKREEKFIAFVQERFRNQVKEQPKKRLGLIKNLISFAK